MGGSPSQGFNELGDEPRLKRGIFRTACIGPTTMPGSGPAHPKEAMMRFYSRQHRFYCGYDRPTRRNVFGPAVDNTAEIADRNPSGVSGAITGFVTLQPSSRDLTGPPRFLHAFLTMEAINGFGGDCLKR
jgi:hypothetical protein